MGELGVKPIRILLCGQYIYRLELGGVASGGPWHPYGAVLESEASDKLLED